MIKILNLSKSFGRCIIFFVFILFANVLHSQDIVVTYESSISLTDKLSNNSSLKIAGNGQDTLINNFSLPKGFELTTFLSEFDVKGNDSTATIFKAKRTSTSWKNSEDAPDSTKLASGRWYAYKDGVKTEVLPDRTGLEPTGEFKIIQGLKCERIIGKSQLDQSISVDLWVTSELPETLVPTYMFPTKYGAVLEARFHRSGISFKATDIKTL